MRQSRTGTIAQALILLIVLGPLAACSDVLDSDDGRLSLTTDRTVYAPGEVVSVRVDNSTDDAIRFLGCDWLLERWRSEEEGWYAAQGQGCVSLGRTVESGESITYEYGLGEGLPEDPRYRLHLRDLENVPAEQTYTNEFEVRVSDG